MRLLAPLGMLFDMLARRRVAFYRGGLLRTQRLGGPVVSIGNLSVGGSGKTPVVEHLARALLAEGVPVAILSRGYRGSYRGRARLVSDGTGAQMDAAEAGDEPVMLARALPGVVVAVGRKRVDAGRLVEERFGRRVHLLDDGFQHLALARQLDVVCVGGGDLVDRPLPAGRLRESPSALSRADVVLAMDGEATAADVRRFAPRADVHVVRRLTGPVLDAAGATCPVPARPFLVSGIARPERFEQDARAVCPAPAGAAAFGDHHAWSAGERQALATQAQRAGADAVLTTAKDAVRLPATLGGLPVLVLAQRLEISDPGRLLERLLVVARP